MSFLSRLLGKKQGDTPIPAAAEAPAEFTFKQRVEGFWHWFESVAPRFYQTIEDKKSTTLTAETSSAVDRFLPRLAWNYGPGENGKGHSLTLSGEGMQPEQILAEEWRKRAPKLEGWTFYAERQASPNPGDFTIKIGEIKFKPIEFWVTPVIDEEEEKVDLAVWHPLADGENKGVFQTALFLFLDEIFGEYGTGRWIGSIEIGKDKLAQSLPITELKEFVKETVRSLAWKMHVPFDLWSGYRIPEDKIDLNRPRLDTISGSSLCFGPLAGFLDNPAAAEDPFCPLGADWIYLSFDSSFFGDRNPVDVRGDIEERIDAQLSAAHAGKHIGGAIGIQRSYIDFLVFDGQRSIDIIRESARAAGMPDDSRIEYLAADKRHWGRRLF